MKNKFERDNKMWLSDNRYESGAIVRYVSAISYVEEGDKPKFVEASLILKDCNRTVQLDFDAHDKKSFQSRLDKITTLINELEEFKMDLMDAAALCADRWKEAESGSDNI